VKQLHVHPVLHPRSLSTNTQGASLLELALILPLIFAFIAGLIDFGFKLNSIKQISQAARHSARIAASHSRRVMLETGIPADCSVPNEPATPVQGVCPKGAQQTLMKNDSVAGAGLKAACNTIAESGLNPEQWYVRATVKQADVETRVDGSRFEIARVEISRVGTDCLICYDRLHEAFESKSESEFVLEEACQ
jgi:hypothetical protein